MIELVGLAGAVVLALVVWRGAPIYREALRRGSAPGDALAVALGNVRRPENYWWGTRLEQMSVAERQAILAGAASRRGLQRIDNLHCPLCGTEIERVLTLTHGGELTARFRSQCPQCDFRLDSCRHCGHFQPERGPGLQGFDWNGASGGSDYGSGRCGFYKDAVPVEEAGLSSAMVKTMVDRGYDVIRAGRPIVDSYVPLDSCRAFLMDERRLRMNGVKIEKERKYLLRLQQTDKLQG